MKTIYAQAVISLLCILFIQPLYSQHQLSLDLGYIREENHHAQGLNVSCFYYFNKHLKGGFELNRFFPVVQNTEEELLVSSWDAEINFHYLVPVSNHLCIYPITGISHTSEKEENESTHHSYFERFWSVNTGAGILWKAGRWLPHLEYTFTWGQLNQQFFLVGISYEIETGHHSNNGETHH